jgi:hypothetical protein
VIYAEPFHHSSPEELTFPQNQKLASFPSYSFIQSPTMVNHSQREFETEANENWMK